MQDNRYQGDPSWGSPFCVFTKVRVLARKLDQLATLSSADECHDQGAFSQKRSKLGKNS
jgi:hypothetical protein